MDNLLPLQQIKQKKGEENFQEESCGAPKQPLKSHPAGWA